VKTFITGATGFIGTHLVRLLAQTEQRMRCLVRTPAKARLLKELGVAMVLGHVTDQNCVREGIQGCGAVMHVAGLMKGAP
jgi:dihydroflavonol-4-reductase